MVILKILCLAQSWLGAFLLFASIPRVAASGLTESPFPDISFQQFSDFVMQNFNSTISLSSVLVILFSLTENVQLLRLHRRQQVKKYPGENSTKVSAWIRVLSRSLRQKLEEPEDRYLLREDDMPLGKHEEQITIALAKMLDSLAKLLQLHRKLKPVSHKAIEPILVICPDVSVCQTQKCNPRSLVMSTKQRDIPYATLIKGFKAYKNVPVLTGTCVTCKTIYYADHERSPTGFLEQPERTYLNSAKYIKIGQSLWVDRSFSSAVLSGVYNFHASASAYTEFWNDAFCASQTLDVGLGKVSRRQIWHAFVQESIRMIGSLSNLNLTLRDNLPIEEVTKEAFHVLGEGGMIRAADGHSCTECTQKHRGSEALLDSGSEDEDAENIRSPVKMVVVDGIVTGHSICAYPDCASELLNSRGGVYCALHEDLYGGQCHVSGCTRQKVEGTLACSGSAHQEKWQRFHRSHQTKQLSGFRRALRHADDAWPWMAQLPNNNQQPHDQEVVAHGQGSRDHFIPRRVYCVETICAPCGVVVAWAKFANAESPTNILNFLEQVFPTEESRPDYICIDKACLVLRTSVSNGSWEQTWSKTSRFIVDSYHYTNHSVDDNLCREWCNPTPRDGSAPNLVVTGRARDGQSYQKSAFNTQACEQLNAWLGGFDSVLRKMTPGNFNWFLHTMLTYHTSHVCRKLAKAKSDVSDSSSGESSSF